MTAVTESGAGPRYRQIGAQLKREIEDGRFSGTELLPGERELSLLFDVSRTTLRRAIAALVQDGVLYHRHGAGTFIRRPTPHIEQPLSRLTSFTEDMALRGLEATSRDIERGAFLPTPEEAMMLGLSPSEGVIRLSRLRLADGVPMAVELATVPRRHVQDPHLIKDSLYTFFEAHGLRPVRALQRLRATILPDEYAALLAVPKRSAALYIQRIAFLSDGRCIEFTCSYYRSDTYDFVSELTLPPALRKGPRNDS